MIIYYRISDGGYSKIKPDNVTNENCLRNFCKAFLPSKHTVKVIADNVKNSTYSMIQYYISEESIQRTFVGNGAATFNLTLTQALTHPDNEIIYFVEDDYVHKPEAHSIMLEGFTLGADFISLYDHPDKYLDPSERGNPYCEGGAEDTRVYLTDSCHWKLTNSTTMTFAARVSTLKKYEQVLRDYTSTTHPYDFDMWIDLRKRGASLITPIPGYSTHGETAWLSPLTDWSSVC